jgi:sigma-E factor negative regulatory protein RseA
MKPQASPTAQAGDDDAANARLCLSALLDGHPPSSGAQAVQRACALWREDGQTRQDWHAWHLIGDVMRSEELARPPSADAAFLGRLRERLAAEPVVLAPAPIAASAPPAARSWRQAWLLPTAVAAGFVAVAGVLVVARTGPAASVPTLASTAAPGLSLVALPGTATPAAPGGAGLVRDPQLDTYLRAHQAARGSMAAAVPGGGMRNVEATLGPGAER